MSLLLHSLFSMLHDGRSTVKVRIELQIGIEVIHKTKKIDGEISDLNGKLILQMSVEQDIECESVHRTRTLR